MRSARGRIGGARVLFGLKFAGAALLAALLASCGGAIDIAGVGSGGTGLAEGTVTGFGSIIVDGTEYDDAGAPIVAEQADGTLAPAVARVGERVRLTLDAQSRAQSVQVLPQLVGAVTAAPGGGWLQVLGQWVRVFDQATGADPATVLAGGPASSADFAAGDPVDVHGTWSWSAGRGAYVLRATRVERLAAAPATVVLGGVVAAVDAEGFRINSTLGTRVAAAPLPAGVATGATVRVWAPAYDAAGDTATALRVEPGAPPAADGTQLRITGDVLAFDSAARRIVVQGLDAAIPSGVDAGAIAAGDFVELVATRGASGWLVSSVQPRVSSDQFGGVVELKGMVGGVDWTAASGPLSFTLRGTPVVVPADVLAASGCGAAAAATASPTAVAVAVRAATGPVPLVANSISCGKQSSPNAAVTHSAAP